MEIALVSFDGIDPRVIYDNPDWMPNLHEHMEGCMHGKWKTPGHTIPSYLSTLTGEQYPVTDFRWDKDEGGFARHRQTEYDFIWDQCDASMSLLNIPVLYPPEDIKDCMVCGFLTPNTLEEDNLAKPEELQDKLNYLDYIPDVDAGDLYDEMGGEGMIDFLNIMMERRVEAAEYIISKYDSDLFYGVWAAPDRWFHQCHLHDEEFEPLYRAVDRHFLSIKKAIPDDVPMVTFSDHGFAHFPRDNGVNKGHMYEGWYSIRKEGLPACRDDSLSIFDLYPTVLNYLGCEIPDGAKGRVIFNNEEQDKDIKDRLAGLGYVED